MPSIAAKLLFFLIPFSFFQPCFYAVDDQKADTPEIRVGAANYDAYLPLLRDKKTALFANHSSVFSRPLNTKLSDSNSHWIRTIDLLVDSGIQVVKIFAPEHGVFGKAADGEAVEDDIDPVQKIPVVSLYGKKKKPDSADLAGVQVVVFDIQDVGVRAYTYISSLHLMMEACAAENIPLIVLDRPNPNAHIIDGPMLDTVFRSFVGMHPIPFAYGMTIGELARMINGEGWLNTDRKCELTVISCANYTHSTTYTLPVNPSPNLPNMRSVYLYPSLCFFEGTTFSIGRGTPYPFQVIGHPDLNPGHYSFFFTPKSVRAAPNPKHLGRTCYGLDLRTTPIDSLTRTDQLNLSLLISLYREFPERESFFRSDLYFDKLAGTDAFRKMLQDRFTEEDIRQSWAADLAAFRQKRTKYLLYPE